MCFNLHLLQIKYNNVGLDENEANMFDENMQHCAPGFKNAGWQNNFRECATYNEGAGSSEAMVMRFQFMALVKRWLSRSC